MTTLAKTLRNWGAECLAIFREKFFKWLVGGAFAVAVTALSGLVPHVKSILLSHHSVPVLWGFAAMVAVLLVGVFVGMLSQSGRIRTLESFARTDELTQINNYREFNDRLKEEIQRIKRGSGAVSLVLIDLDGFKEINDQHGYESGDLVLKEFAGLLKHDARDTDIVCRFKMGDEFVAILPDTTLVNAKVFAERLRCNVQNYQFSLKGGGVLNSLRFSAGIVTMESPAGDTDPASDKEIEDLIARAESVLAEAKKFKNTVEIESCDRGAKS